MPSEPGEPLATYAAVCDVVVVVIGDSDTALHDGDERYNGEDIG